MSTTSFLAVEAGKYWSNIKPVAEGSRWWLHPPILRHINRIICGEPLPGVVDGDAKVIASLNPSLSVGVSVGCGEGRKEMMLLQKGVVERFVLYEVAEARIEKGIVLAERLGLSARVEFRREILAFDEESPRADLVYWNNALHHMPNTEKALRWSRSILNQGGVFYMNDFVGPTRMQYAPEVLRVGTTVRASLPDRFMLRGDGTLIARAVRAPDPDLLAKIDPSECVDSGSILPALTRVFPNCVVRPTGGAIYGPALNDVLANFGPDDEHLLTALLLLDEQLALRGFTNYASVWDTRYHTDQ